MFRYSFPAAGLAALLLATAGGQAKAQGVLLSAQTVVLHDKARSASITIANPTEKPSTFRVSDAFFLQGPDGALRGASPKGPPNSAENLLRIGPRRFSLEPGEGQTLRVALRPPENLAPGEYRLHLSAANMAQQATEPAEANSDRGQGDGLSVTIKLAVARAVRVLVRHQVRPEGGRVEAVSAQGRGGTTTVSFDAVRLGQTSLLAVHQVFARGANGKELRAWPERGASVYAELPRRRIESSVPSGEIPAGATLCVRLLVKDPQEPTLPASEACAGGRAK